MSPCVGILLGPARGCGLAGFFGVEEVESVADGGALVGADRGVSEAGVDVVLCGSTLGDTCLRLEFRGEPSERMR